MGALFNILLHSIGSLILGIVLTIAGVALMFFLIKSWKKSSTFTPLSFIVGVVLFVFLAFQSILICGAVTIKGYGLEAENLIDGYVSSLPSDMVLSRQDSQSLIERLGDDLPIVGYYVNLADFSGCTVGEISQAMTDELQSYMNWYILRRALWSLLFIVVGATLVIKTMDRVRSGRRAASSFAKSKFYDE